jgi:hypothetical protein
MADATDIFIVPIIFRAQGRILLKQQDIERWLQIRWQFFEWTLKPAVCSNFS